MYNIHNFVLDYFKHLDSFGIESFAMIPPSNTIEDINLDEGTIIVATIVVATSFAINYGLRKRK
jgi:hypothetical protein